MSSQATRKESSYHQQALLVAGFLGGIAFTGLILVLQSPDKFYVPTLLLSNQEYFALLIALMGSASTLLVFASLMMMSIVSGEVSDRSQYWRLVEKTFGLGIIALLGSMPILLLAITEVGAVIVAVLEISLVIIFELADWEEHP